MKVTDIPEVEKFILHWEEMGSHWGVNRSVGQVHAPFLVDCFGHDAVLARSTNHLLVVAFYLVNVGFILLTINLGSEPVTMAEAIRFVATKVGLALLVLGCWHFFNMQMIARYGRQVGRWVRENHGARPV